MFFITLGRCVAVFGIALFALQSCTHESHEHHDHPHPEEIELPTRSYTLFGSTAMLFLEHPVLVQGQSARFLAHITVLADGSPLASGRVTLRLGDQTFVIDTAKRSGIFIPEGAPTKAGPWSASLSVESPTVQETWSLGEVEVYASQDLATKAPAAPEKEAITFLLEQQWPVGLLVAPAQARTLATQRSVVASLEVREDAHAVISSPVSGRLLLSEGQSWPRLGDLVAAQQGLAWVETPLSTTDQAQLRMWELESRVRQLEAAQQLAQARAQRSLAEQQLTRLHSMRERGLATQSELESAQSELAQAQLSFEAAQQRLTHLAALPETLALRTPLVAPISGQVVAVQLSQGQAVNAGESLLEIVDPTRLRVRAQVPEAQVELLSTVSAVELALVLAPEQRVSISAERLLSGVVLDSATRSLPLWLDLEAPHALWKPGMAAELRLRIGERASDCAIPLEAVVPDQGLATAYVQVAGEAFERRVLKLGARDGTHVEVLSGVVPGERVATRGSHYVRLASMAPEGFGHGHAH